VPKPTRDFVAKEIDENARVTCRDCNTVLTAQDDAAGRDTCSYCSNYWDDVEFLFYLDLQETDRLEAA